MSKLPIFGLFLGNLQVVFQSVFQMGFQVLFSIELGPWSPYGGQFHWMQALIDHMVIVLNPTIPNCSLQLLFELMEDKSLVLNRIANFTIRPKPNVRFLK